jgi:ARG/rhodanese/phosphatase superfamily protein
MEITVKAVQREKELTIVQFSTANQDTFNYMSLSNAIKKDLLEIREISKEGDVNNLAVFNLAKEYVFIMDGDILEGAKQNRVVNTSVLLAPNSKMILPVSCVEQGRWNSVSDKFKEANYTAPIRMRAKKTQRVKENLDQSRGHESNQSEVWDDVHNYHMSFDVNSETSNLSDIYNSKSIEFDSYINAFSLEPDSNGIALIVKKQLLSVDVFNSKNIYMEYFTKILKSAAFESFQLKKSKDHPTEAESKYKTLTFFDSLDNIDYTEYDGPGVGIEKRFQSENLAGVELSYKKHMIHLTALNIPNN